jgi:hypothetical protein
VKTKRRRRKKNVSWRKSRGGRDGREGKKNKEQCIKGGGERR